MTATIFLRVPLGLVLLALAHLPPTIATAQPQPSSPARSLRVSQDGHTLERPDGKPFLYLGDTAWMLFVRSTRAEAELYLKDRADKGFTVIQASALSLFDGVSAANAYRHQAFLGDNPSTPNEDYFQHVDFVVNKAQELGLFVGFLPTWGNHWKRRNPDRPPIFTSATARAYGVFLGKRYRDKPIIWILGGDDNPTAPDERAVIDALAAGLREGDGGRHLITFHPRGPGLSSTFLQDAGWLDFHMSQSSHAALGHDTGLYIEHDRKLSPTRPTLDGEPRYEGIQVGFYLRDHNRLLRFDDVEARAAAWWAMLAGACGHTYGNNSIWQMWLPGRPPQFGANAPWTKAIHHPGAFQMGHLRKLYESRPWQHLQPAQDWIASGPRDGAAKVRAALATDGSFAFVYSPEGQPFTLDQRRLRGDRVRESWYDPRYGVLYPIHVGDTKGFQTYTPPTAGRGQDWVLVLDDEAAGYPVDLP
ncbi:MAG: glycoside hydrolase family 140 protein [Bryobacterales bacterium]|jgi:hypothetical protein|nr:glycoside hydrolase family 140 protein [Bryobacterales bacterium]